MIIKKSIKIYVIFYILIFYLTIYFAIKRNNYIILQLCQVKCLHKVVSFMSVTIKDVAKKADVSPSTVSRVINGKGCISEETKDKVFSIMHDMNYFPNGTARSFVNGNTSAIALIIDTNDVSSYSNNFFNNSVFGIETAAHNTDYNLIITSDRLSRGHLSSAEKLVYGKKTDGIILPTSMVKQSFVQRLREIGFPYVILGQPPSLFLDSNWVDVNNIQGGTISAEYLFRQGYKKIAFLSSEEKKTFNKDRITGYKRALDASGSNIDEKLIISGTSSLESGFEMMNLLLNYEDKPDCAICSDYYIAVGALRAAKKRGLRIPEKFGIISFDDSVVAQLSDPPITTVDTDTFDLGEQAATILINAIHNKELTCRQILISTKIIERGSTKRNVPN